MARKKDGFNSREVKFGQEFVWWTVCGEPVFRRYRCGLMVRLIPCECRCGTKRLVNSRCLFVGRSTSCGCRSHEMIGSRSRKHGESKSPLYLVWQGMKSRCENPNDASYANYGGRGIRVCEVWRGSFGAFRDWALASGFDEAKTGKQKLTIDRIDNDGHYEPGNCRWSTRKEQMNNIRKSFKVEAFGETKTLAQWISDPRCVVKYHTLYQRLVVHGWPAEAALATSAVPGRPTADRAARIRG